MENNISKKVHLILKIVFFQIFNTFSRIDWLLSLSNLIFFNKYVFEKKNV